MALPIVVDGSALVEVVLRTTRGSAVLSAAGVQRMAAPDLVDLEVLSVLRRLERRGTVSAARALEAVLDLRDTVVWRVPVQPFYGAIWALRANLTPYDASYVALAQSLNCAVITADARLSRAPRLPVPVIVV